MAYWELSVDARAAAGRGLDDARAAEQARALLHAGEPEAARLARLGETHAVIAPVPPTSVVLADQNDLDARGARVLAGVRQRFLENSERGGLDRRRQPDASEVLDQAHRPAGVSGDVVEALTRGCRPRRGGHRHSA